MTIREVIANVSGMEDVISLEVTGSSGITRFSVVARSCALGIGDTVSIVAGFADGSYTLLNGGLIDTVTAERPPGVYRAEGRDRLKLALDNFIVSANLDESAFFNASPGTPGNYELVTPGEVISAILAQCGLPGVSGGAGWELGTVEYGTPFQLVSAWDAIQQVCAIGAWKVWCSASSGAIMFNSIFEPGGGGGSLSTGDEGQILSCSHGWSEEDLRNKIVVIGAPNPDGGHYSAVASAASPYLPSGFYKTAVVSTDLIGSDEQAQSSADANLAALNKLTEITTAEATGIGLELYGSVSVSEPFTGGGGGMITSITHTIDDNGYRVRLRAKAV